MGITTEAYRAAIGVFVTRVRDKKNVFPQALFKSKYYFCFYGIHEWSKYITSYENKHGKQVRGIFQSIIVISLLLNCLVLMCGDIHPNPGPNCHRQELNICHANIRSIKAKDAFTTIKCELGKKFDIILMSETWLSDRDKTTDFKISGYQKPFRRDRSIGAAGYGGIMAYVTNDIACKRRKDYEVKEIEGMWLEVRVIHEVVFLFLVYRAESNTDSNFWQLLQNSIDTVRADHNPKILVIGDLNADPATRQGKYLNDFANVNFLTQHVTEPTRITATSSTILDQIMSNFPSLVKQITVEPPLASSDHCLITAKCIFKVKKKRAYKRRMWLFKDADYSKYRENLDSIETDALFNNNDVDSICVLLNERILSSASYAIPNKWVTVRPSDKPWYNGHHRRLAKTKHTLFKNFKKDRSKTNWDKFLEARSAYIKEIGISKQEFEDTKYIALAKEGEKNNKKWWTLLKKVYTGSDCFDTIPPIEINNKIVTDDQEKAELFNEFFATASSVDDKNASLPNQGRVFLMGNNLNDIIVTEKEVSDQIKLLDSNKSYGPDGISPLFIKEGGNKITTLLCQLFNKSLSTGKFPNEWKKANVIPIHKKDLTTSVKNYRPVSLLSVISKVFERIVFKHIYNFFKENFILNSYQSGFQSGMSTVTQLLEINHQFCKAIDEHKEIRVVFLDIRKAFDKVWHKGLLYKLSLSGINGNLLAWITDYLSNRMQRVVLNGQHSCWKTIDAGVPQGSVLGPLLFLLYINDITSQIKNVNIRLFADDTCLFIDVDDRINTALQLEEDLETINLWGEQWLVDFAPEKTKSLIISNKRDAYKNPSVKFGGHPVEEVSEHTYLGLLFTSKMSWNSHINNVAIKTRKKMNLMIPLKFKLDRKSLESMLNSFVISSMSYAIEIWGCTYDSQLLKLEQIIVDSMRLLTGATNGSNISNLYNDTGWLTFIERRNNAVVKMTYKMKHNMVPHYLSGLLPHQNQDCKVYQLRNRKNLTIPQANKNVMKFSFIHTAVKLWNKLELDVRQAPSYCNLKLKLTKMKRNKNILYYYGKRWVATIHARLRIGCSKLNYDLSFNLHIPNIDPACECGAPLEDVKHYFMTCLRFENERDELKQNVERITNFNVKVLLFGSSKLKLEENKIVFDAVHRYIMETGRFK